MFHKSADFDWSFGTTSSQDLIYSSNCIALGAGLEGTEETFIGGEIFLLYMCMKEMKQITGER